MSENNTGIIGTILGTCSLNLWHVGQDLELTFSGFHCRISGANQITAILDVFKNSGEYEFSIPTGQIHLARSDDREGGAVSLQGFSNGVSRFAVLSDTGRINFIDRLEEALQRESIDTLLRRLDS